MDPVARGAERPDDSDTDTQRSQDSSKSSVTVINVNFQELSPYTVLSEREKRFFIVVVSTVNFLGPLTASIYYPALGPLSRELHVSHSMVNLTITSYMILLGIIPLWTAGFSDQHGRRLILLGCLISFMLVNIALALQTSFPALLGLRCLQGLSTSNISVIATATIADVITRAQRGKYMAYITLGPTIGGAAGPIVGGLLTQSLGWRSIFWTLSIFAGLMAVLVLGFLPETCRATVGNGSIPTPPINRPLLETLLPKTRRRSQTPPDPTTLVTFKRRPGVLGALKILFSLESGPLILYNMVFYCGFTAVISTIPSLYERTYHLNPLQIGLVYLPYVLGGMTARWTVGPLADWNFHRHATTANVPITKNHQSFEQLARIPLERARLQLVLPLVYLSCLFLAAYGWSTSCRLHLAVPLVLLFFLGNTMTGTSSTLNLLNIDLNAHQPATAAAAMNLLRFTSGAGIAAAAIPLSDAIGIGWTGTLFAGVWLVASPLLWGYIFMGMDGG